MMSRFKRAHLLKAYKVVIKRVVERFTGGGRTDSIVKTEYGQLWDESGKNDKKYIGSPQVYYRYNRFALLRRIDRKKSLIKHVDNFVKALRPKNILEVGSGAGMNILCLAILNPEISFTGIELTKEGVATAQNLIKNPPIKVLMFTLGMSEQDILNRLAMVQITFTCGDMRNMPYKNDSTDFVFSYLAIEQIARNCGECFNEVQRILKPNGEGHALFIESFKEAQTTYAQRVYLWACDYFRFSLQVLEKSKLRILQYQEMEFQNFQMGLGSVLVDKI